MHTPISFRAFTIDADMSGLSLDTALIISDVTADPESACKAVARKFGTAKYYDASEISAAELH